MHAWLTMVLLSGGPVETRLALAETRPLSLTRTYHVQGLAMDAERVYVSSVERASRSGWLFVLDRPTLSIRHSYRLAIGDQFHPGGMQLQQGVLHLPLAEYRALSTSVLLRVDPSQWSKPAKESRRPTIAVSHAVDDHVGCLACDDQGVLYAGNWDCKQFRVMDATGRKVREFSNPTGVAYQDFEWHESLLWCAGNLKEGNQLRSVVDVIDPQAGACVRRYLLEGTRATGGSDFAHEGFTKEGNRLWLLPEDGPNSTLYRFDLPNP